MSGIKLLDEIISAGAKVSADGDELKILASPNLLTPEVVAQLRTLKPQIMAELRKGEEVAPSATGARVEVASETEGTPAPKAVVPTIEPHIVGQIAAWRQLTLCPPYFGSPSDSEELLKAARAFLNSEWAPIAIGLGWDEIELFGIHLFAPRIRLDAWGLVPNLAWSRLPAPIQIIALGSDEATFQTATGSAPKIKRRPTGYLNAKPFWTAFKGGSNAAYGASV